MIHFVEVDGRDRFALALNDSVYDGHTGAHLMTLVTGAVPSSAQDVARDGLVKGNPVRPHCESYAHGGDEHAPDMCWIPSPLLSLIEWIALAYHKHRVYEYAHQADAGSLTPDKIIPNTPFSNVIVNFNRALPEHVDQGVYSGGMVAFACLRSGNYTGGHYELTDYGVSADLQSGDVLLVTPGLKHRNTPIEGTPDEYLRITVACYLRSALVT